MMGSVGNIVGAGVTGALGIATIKTVDKLSKRIVKHKVKPKLYGGKKKMKYYVRTWLKNLRRYFYKEFPTLADAQRYLTSQQRMGRTARIFKKKRQ